MSDLPSITLLGTAAKELANDVLAISYRAMQEGANAEDVQNLLRKNVADALLVISPFTSPGEVEVETSGFQVQPRYNAKQKLDGYRGLATITVKGTDTATISQLTSKVKSMVVSSTSNSISRAARSGAEAELVSAAIIDFRQKADEAARGFGWKSWELGSVNIRTDGGSARAGKMFAMGGSAGGAESAPFEVESGKSEITTTVSGSITKKK